MDISQFGGVLGITSFSISFVVLMTWSLVWKGLALWKAARNGNKVWFVALLIVNTLGILEIIYIYIISKKSLDKQA